MTTRFLVEQHFDVGLEECIAFMSDPGLQAYLAGLEGVQHRQVTGFRQEGSKRYWQVEVAMAEQLPAFARSMLRPDQLRWVQKFVFDTDALEFQYHVEHGLPSSMLEARGTGQLRGNGPDKTIIAIDGEITSHIPMIGRRIEILVAQRAKTMLELDGRRRNEYMDAHRGNARPLVLDEHGNPADPRVTSV